MQCNVCGRSGEHKVFSSFAYWYCADCKAEIIPNQTAPTPAPNPEQIGMRSLLDKHGFVPVGVPATKRKGSSAFAVDPDAETLVYPSITGQAFGFDIIGPGTRFTAKTDRLPPGYTPGAVFVVACSAGDGYWQAVGPDGREFRYVPQQDMVLV